MQDFRILNERARKKTGSRINSRLCAPRLPSEWELTSPTFVMFCIFVCPSLSRDITRNQAEQEEMEKLPLAYCIIRTKICRGTNQC